MDRFLHVWLWTVIGIISQWCQIVRFQTVMMSACFSEFEDLSGTSVPIYHVSVYQWKFTKSVPFKTSYEKVSFGSPVVPSQGMPWMVCEALTASPRLHVRRLSMCCWQWHLRKIEAFHLSFMISIKLLYLFESMFLSHQMQQIPKLEIKGAFTMIHSTKSIHNILEFIRLCTRVITA